MRRSLAEREAHFLCMVERGIYGHATSPYLPLLRMAGCEFGDIREMVRRQGLEATLRALHQGGVHVRFEEFKGRYRIDRGGQVWHVCSRDFENPHLLRHYEARTGASRGAGTRLFVDFDLMTHEAAAHSLFLTAFGLTERPFGLWRPLPPGVSGLFNVLRHAKLAKRVERWFTQSEVAWGSDEWKDVLLTLFTVHGSRFSAQRLPVPEPVPLGQAHRVARWLASKCRQGNPAFLDTNGSSGVRVCLAAREKGLDIAGTLFRLGGEPYTAAKAQAFAQAGCSVASHYSMAEIGRIGVACAAPAALDDVHLLTDKLAVIQVDKRVGRGGTVLPAFVFTTLHPSSPFIMLNVETDDYGVLERRDCGCPLGRLGLTQHLHTIRSYEKLTSEGMTFYGSDLFHVIEEVLPARFGGQSTDYQFVESDEGGLPRVSVVVHPRLGNVDEAEVRATVLAALRACPDGPMMTDRWLQADTIRAVRRVPYATPSAKTLPLHVLRGGK
ncbi:MAG: hypothetical protein K2R98_07595 [Gemmataceae bacterium]|nr:hypothetical protein [Gemmataceae bacterium]